MFAWLRQDDHHYFWRLMPRVIFAKKKGFVKGIQPIFFSNLDKSVSSILSKEEARLKACLHIFTEPHFPQNNWRDQLSNAKWAAAVPTFQYVFQYVLFTVLNNSNQHSRKYFQHFQGARDNLRHTHLIFLNFNSFS